MTLEHITMRGGIAYIRDTEVSADELLRAVAAGMRDRIFTRYPALTFDDVEAAIAYAQQESEVLR